MQVDKESAVPAGVQSASSFMRIVTALLGAFVSGVLMGLCVPPNGLWWLAFVALAPLYATAFYVPSLLILLQGLICGFVAGLIVFLEFPGDFWNEFLYFLLFGYMVGITAMFARWRGRLDRLRDIVVVGAVGVLMEWGFHAIEVPITFALTISRDFPLLQLAGITGVWGLSFLLWASSASVAGARLHQKLTPALKGLGIALLAIHIGGSLSTLVSPPAEHTLRVASAQPFYGHIRVLEEAKKQGAELVVLPEASTSLSVCVEPGSPPQYEAIWRQVSYKPSVYLNDNSATLLAQHFQVALIAGHSYDDYNCASLILPNGKVIGTYKKMYPFGAEKYHIKRGERAIPFETEWGKIGVVICYDTMFSRPVRETVRAGAQLVAVPTYDPIAPRYALHHIHSSMALIRSAEHRVPIIVSERCGLSTITDRFGRLVWQAGELEHAVHTVAMPLCRSGTLYTWLGDYMIVLCALVLILALSRRL